MIEFDQTPLRQHPHRWALSRAGFVNVWHYYENTFDISGGRLILRGTNGSGKSRALEMLLPFLLDADRRNMGTGSSVRMEDLMSAGAGEQGNRLGYMWIELRCDPDPVETNESRTQYLTLGALVRYAIRTKEAKVWYFTTPLRVGRDLPLLGADRQPLSRSDLAELISEERITDVPEKHRERVRTKVFGLTGQLGKERFDGLAKLLHTLRSPDVGNRIEEGRLPAILADALPPLSEDALTDAGHQLDGLTSTREDQQRLEAAREQIQTFLGAYRKYVAGVLTTQLQAVRTGAASVQEAEREAERLATKTETLREEVTKESSQLNELTEKTEQLEATLQGLRKSEAYRGAEELDRLSTVVQSLASAADSALKAAAELRHQEAEKVADTGPLADDVEHAAAAVSEQIQRLRELLAGIGLTEHGLQGHVRVDRRPGTPASDVIRTSRDRDTQEERRPVADVLALEPSNLAVLTDAAHRAQAAAQTRTAQAANRAADAKTLAEERRTVDKASDEAFRVEMRAEEDEQAAQQAAEQRDDAALGLVDQWRDWMANPATVDLLGITDWSTNPILGLLLADRTVLCGDGDTRIDLPDLDGAAVETMTAATSALAAALARLEDADKADQKRVKELVLEQTSLKAARDPEPQLPTWVTHAGGVPLWRCLDFAEPVGAEHRAGIEAAMLASGLLTATVDSDGRLTASNGQLLVSPTGDPVPRSLSIVLTVDPASPLPADSVLGVLERIGFDSHTASVWIGPDGSWGNGPLRGRHHAHAAQHIGAAARAAARATRLAEIESELSTLAEAAEKRQAQREQVHSRQRALRERQRSSPRSMALAQARTRAVEAARQAGRSATQARQLRVEADELARAWAKHDREHRQACSEFGLPEDEDSLRTFQQSAERAVTGCAALITAADAVAKAHGRFTTAVTRIGEVTERRLQAEHSATGEWRTWHSENTQLETLTATIGAAALDVQQQIATTEFTLTRTKDRFRATSEKLQGLIHSAGIADAEARGAAAQVAQHHTDLTARVTTAVNQLSEPGIVDTAFPVAPGKVFTDLDPGAVDANAEMLLASLSRGRSDENALLRAQQVFEQAISGSYDVAATIATGIRLFELIDGEGRRPLAQAAVEINRQCEIGRTTLTEREHQVFSKFVIGEVGEELRRRLSQANNLITAMNTSLKSIQTSHGIGVRLTWKLAEHASGDVARIKELITTAAAVRTPAQDSELTDLLSRQVAAEAVKDPTAGYAVHLRSALNYRTWHTVEVIITGPEEGRERRISRRAKLSQGETRFVSYVTLFAAVDAYLSGLDSTTMALRLILLDDAFAKVDEPTIAELLGLLVRLDVDFVMTGHALWGCVPQVPTLDIYEICREDGTPAATPHVHWDGHNRHYLRAT